MMVSSKLCSLGTLLAVLASPVLSVQLFPSPGSLPTTIPASCRAALSTNITCSELITAANTAAQVLPYDAELTGYCTSNCSASLLTVSKNIKSSCNGYISYDNYTTTGGNLIDPFVWAYKVTCLSDTNGLCLPRVLNGSATACSDCSMKYKAAMLSSPYGQNRVNADQFSSTLSSCKISATKYPTTGATSTPVTGITTTTTGVAPGAPTCYGSRYTVKSADTCISIGNANSIATDRLISDNGIDYNCTTIRVGNKFCIQNPCKLQTVKKGDTCDTYLTGKAFYLQQFLSWNPTIHDTCDNLGAMIGRSICISPPGSKSYSVTSVSYGPKPATLTLFPTKSFVSGTTKATSLKRTTKYLMPTKTTKVPTRSMTGKASSVLSQYQARQKYCPITPEDWTKGWLPQNLPLACQNLISPYCFPNLSSAAPTSTRFPAVCTPAYYSTNSSTATR